MEEGTTPASHRHVLCEAEPARGSVERRLTTLSVTSERGIPSESATSLSTEPSLTVLASRRICRIAVREMVPFWKDVTNPSNFDLGHSCYSAEIWILGA